MLILGPQIKENFRYSPFVIGLKFSFLYSSKIKEQTRKLAAGWSKHRFEVVDRTDEVSSKHCSEVVDGS